MRWLCLLWVCLAGMARAELVEVVFYTQPSEARVSLQRAGGPLVLGKTGQTVRLPAELLSGPTLDLVFELPGHQRGVATVPVAPLLEARRWPLSGAIRLVAAEERTLSVTFHTQPQGAAINAFNSARQPAYLGLSGRPVQLDRAWLKRGSAVEVEFSRPGYQTWSETIPTGLLRDGASWPPPGKKIALVPTGWTRVRQAAWWLLLLPVLGWVALRVRRQPLSPMVETPSAPAELTVPGYTILEQIGSGGMADVYRVAREGQSDTLAMKVLHADLAREPDAAKRIRREIRLWRDLVHPNIVPLYDFGEVDGRYYLVMERVEGRTLRAVLEEGGVSLEESLRIVDCLLDGMAYAHARGIVHRDLKPENVMLRYDGRVLILDFGLSRSLNQESTMITMPDKVMGTPAYLAPERLSGQAGPECDQYALGIIAYELLAGRHPLNDLDDMAVVITQHLFEKPRSIRELRPEVPPEVDAMVLRMLEKKPRARFPDLTQARAALRGSARV